MQTVSRNCPNCGREDDAAIEAVMNDLSKAFADLGVSEPAPKEPAAPAESSVVEDDTILFRPEEIKDAEKQATQADSSNSADDLNSAIAAAMQQIADESNHAVLENEPPKAEDAPQQDETEQDDTILFDADQVSKALEHTAEPMAQPEKPESAPVKHAKP